MGNDSIGFSSFTVEKRLGILIVAACEFRCLEKGLRQILVAIIYVSFPFFHIIACPFALWSALFGNMMKNFQPWQIVQSFLFPT
jgi:hypothetical protein